MADRVVIRGVVLTATSLLLGCGGPSGGTVSLVLDIPNAMLDPQGFASVEVRVHHVDGATTEINVPVNNGKFDLGPIEVTPDVLLEATLRTQAGAAVGYGRAAAPVDIEDKATIVIPVRRPIVYIAGLINVDQDGDASTTDDVVWSKSKPSFSDLASNNVPDGTAKLADNAVLSVAAGPRLFMFEQTPMNPSGMLVGAPIVREISTGDHATIGPLATTLDGAVTDAAGSDDGKQLLVATSTHLFVVDTDSGTAKPIADGNFSRVAIVTAGDRALTAVAIKDRSATGQCTAELVWALVNADDTNQTTTLATSGFTDVAGDNGRGFYVDNCKGGELGEASASGTMVLRSSLGKPASVAVTNGQAYIGIERTTGMSVIAAALQGNDMPRSLLDEDATLVVEADDYAGVQRKLEPTSVAFKHLEVGAGGDYVATTISATYDAPRVFDAFPRMEWESEELFVIATATGAVQQRYRSWCDGVMYIQDPFYDIYPWHCTTGVGQSAPSNIALEHHINSMTFLFGKK